MNNEGLEIGCPSSGAQPVLAQLWAGPCFQPLGASLPL